MYVCIVSTIALEGRFESSSYIGGLCKGKLRIKVDTPQHVIDRCMQRDEPALVRLFG